jgi:hypothetical protein
VVDKISMGFRKQYIGKRGGLQNFLLAKPFEKADSTCSQARFMV